MEKLTYEKINNSVNAITIDLHNGYSVDAISGWNPVKKMYIVTLKLRDNANRTSYDIDEAQSLEFETDSRKINSAILKWVGTHFEEGFFDIYIRRCVYENSMFNLALDLLEKGKKIDAYEV